MGLQRLKKKSHPPHISIYVCQDSESEKLLILEQHAPTQQTTQQSY